MLCLLPYPGQDLQADEDDLIEKAEETAEKIKDLIEKYQKAEVNIVKQEVVTIKDTSGNPRDCDMAVFYGNGQQARLTTKDGKFDGNFDHKHNKNVPNKALSVRLSNCECRAIKTKHQVTWLGIDTELEKLKEVLKEEIEEAGKEKAKEYAEKVIQKLAEKVGSGVAAGASSFLSGFKAGADMGAPVGEFITDNINKILDSTVNKNIEAAELNGNAPLYPSVGHAELRGRWGNTFGANPQLRNTWNITVRCGSRVIPPSAASWSNVDDLVKREYRESPAGRQEAADAAAARAEQQAQAQRQREAEAAERRAEAERQAEERKREAERKRREAERKRLYEERQRKLKAKAAEIAKTCTICDPIRNDIKAVQGQIEKTTGEIPDLEQAVTDAEKKADQARNKVKQASQKLTNFRNPSSSATDVESGRTVDSSDLEVRRQASIEAMDRYRDGKQSAQETSEQWEELNDPGVIKDLKEKADKRLEAELQAAQEKSRQADEAVAAAKRKLNAANRKLKELERELKELQAKLEECIKKCKQYSLDIAKGRYTEVGDLMDYSPSFYAQGNTEDTQKETIPQGAKTDPGTATPPAPAANPVGNQDKPVQVGLTCVGFGCSGPVSGFCLGESCNQDVNLNCSGSGCTELVNIVCLDGGCPTVLDYNCNGNSCSSTLDYFCGPAGCQSNPAQGGGFLAGLGDSNPYEFPIKCSGAGCGYEYIGGTCYGSACPETGELSCPGTGCTESIELNCSGNLCDDQFNYDCYGESCSNFLQVNCSGSSCDQLDAFHPSSQPYLTGAAPGGQAILSSGAGVAPTTNASDIKPVVTPRGSSDVIPSSNSDISVLQSAAEKISRNAGACLDADCPKIDCATAATLLQGLIVSEANLDEMYKWLIQASDDAMAHLLSLNENDIITSEQLAQAQDAQALHKYLHDIGSLLLDLASLKEAVDKVKSGEFASGSSAQQLDDVYETLKDFESAVGTIGAANGATTWAPTSNTPGHVIGALGGDAIADSVGAKNATPENIGSAINDVKSQINDAISIVQDAKDGKTPTAAVGKAIGRILKNISVGKMRERQAQMDEYIRNIGANAGAIASSMAFLQKTNSRRFAVEDALKAIRAAKGALMACMVKACGAMSLARPNVSTNFDGWGGALRHFNGLTRGLFTLLDGTFAVEDHCPGTETAISLFSGDGMGSGNTSVIGANTNLTPTHEVTAKCPRCQPIADKLAANLSETDYWRAEKAAIEEKLRQAETLRQRRGVLESRKASNRRSIQQLNQGRADSKAFGFYWGGGLAFMLRQAEARGRDLQRQIEEMSREIDRLEARKNELETIDARLSKLLDERRGLRTDLRYCQEQYCKDYDQDNAAVGRFIGEIFADVELVDVKHVSGNNPYDRRDPIAPDANRIGMSNPVSGMSTGGGTGGTGGGMTGGGGGVMMEPTIQVLPFGSTFIPFDNLSLVGPDACPSDHYHGGDVIACDGSTASDPAPGVCGYGTPDDIVEIPESSCTDPNAGTVIPIMLSASINAQCDVNSGNGTNTLNIDGTNFCNVSGPAPQVAGGTHNFTCQEHTQVTITGTCSTTQCRAFLNSTTNLDCPFPDGGFFGGTFGDSGGYTGTVSENCTCD